MSPFELVTIILLGAIVVLLASLRFRKAVDTAHEAGDVSSPGVPGAFGREIVVVKTVSNGQDRFMLELPGGISRLGRRYYGEVIPVGVIGVTGPGETGSRRATLVFSEDDIASTDQALSAFSQYRNAVPESFAILAESEDVTFEAIVAGVEAGTLGKERPVAVTMRVSARFAGHATAVVSDPFKAWMTPVASRGPGGYEGETEGRHLWDCHAHWYHFFGTGRHTLCHGPCTAGTCLTWWNRKQWEDGWCTCSC